MMLPIPVPIIGSNKRLSRPLIYIVAVSTVCYLILITFIQVHRGNLLVHPYPRYTESNKPKVKFRREIETDFPKPHEITSTASGERRKKETQLFSVKAENTTGQHATRRSDSTQVRVGHQNYHPQLGILDPKLPSVVPWPQDQQCKQFRIQFARKNTFKPR